MKAVSFKRGRFYVLLRYFPCYFTAVFSDENEINKITVVMTIIFSIFILKFTVSMKNTRSTDWEKILLYIPNVM
jgi:hypothetical protein